MSTLAERLKLLGTCNELADQSHSLARRINGLVTVAPSDQDRALIGLLRHQRAEAEKRWDDAVRALQASGAGK